VDIQAAYEELELVNRPTMSSAVDLPALTSHIRAHAHTPSLSNNPSSVAHYATSIAEQTLSAHLDHGDAGTNMFGAFIRCVLFILRIIPGILVWLITFTTITLPTCLFTLFSTSLTFTMNATTLYVYVEKWLLNVY
jgi:hypothetical protein